MARLARTLPFARSHVATARRGHAFFWQDGVMTDLGTLTGDLNSFANDINNKGQVGSGDATSNCRPFLRGNGVMTNLKALNPHDWALYLTWGGRINDRGEITGTACVLSNGTYTSEVPAFWLFLVMKSTPTRGL